MTFKLFFESFGQKLTICDIQPEYQKSIHFDMREFAKFAMQYPEVYVLYNGPDLGFSGQGKIAKWYNSFGIPGQMLRKWKWFDKGYAWFRDVMDSGCWHQPHIVRLARYMIKRKIRDWRDLTDEDFAALKIPDMTKDLVENYGFYIPDLASRIRRINGADICGGGFHECLSEVLILAQAMNVQLNVIDEYTYGR